MSSRAGFERRPFYSVDVVLHAENLTHCELMLGIMGLYCLVVELQGATKQDMLRWDRY